MRTKYIKLAIFNLLLLAACNVETGIEPVEKTKKVDMATYSYISTNVFDQRCALSGCHLNNQNPRLKSDVAYNNIVNKPSSQGLDYIEPGDPDRSYLYKKITGAAGISGARMPRGAAPLSQATIDSIRVWIENGALNN